MTRPKPHTPAEVAEIEDLCRLAKRANKAAEYLKNQTPLAAVRAELVRTAFPDRLPDAKAVFAARAARHNHRNTK
jgi:hypothetical protein